VTLSSKGQIVIPKALRSLLKLSEGDRLRITLHQNRLLLEPVDKKKLANWRSWEGVLKNTHALQDHVAEHAEEVDK
jgi:AbrB family looped-hinge helix DNA binding protein